MRERYGRRGLYDAKRRAYSTSTTLDDATGVQDMPAFAYDMSGKRLATVGYAADVGS